MGFLERAIKRGVSNAVSNAVGNAVEGAVRNVVEPKATQLANKAAGQFEQAANSAMQQTTAVGAASQASTSELKASTSELKASTSELRQSAVGLEGALGNLQRSMENYATQAAKNMKVCPGCGEATSSDKKFCPKCGTKLPEQTLAQGAVCSSCGKQNSIGTKFCQECGAKLPAAIAEEQEAENRDAAVMAQWDTVLSGFPKWSLGGGEYVIERSEYATQFSVRYRTAQEAINAVEQYKNILRQNGFREAGQYPDRDHLYNKLGGICYHVDTEHCFEGDSNNADLYFMYDEPEGGFDYVKPEPKKGFFGLF